MSHSVHDSVLEKETPTHLWQMTRSGSSITPMVSLSITCHSAIPMVIIGGVKFTCHNSLTVVHMLEGGFMA